MATVKTTKTSKPGKTSKPAKTSSKAMADIGPALGVLQGLFEAEDVECLAIDAYPVAEDRLFLAVEAIDKTRAASAILAVTLGNQPTIEVLHASPRSAHDYVYDDSSDTHVLLQGGGVLRLRAGVETFTPCAQPLHRIALAGDVVVACGGTEAVAIAEDGTISPVAIDTQFELHAIAAIGKRIYAGSRSGTLFAGDCHGLQPVVRVDGVNGRNLDILSLHPTPEGAVLIGGRDGAARFADGVVTRLELDPYATWGRAVCVDGGAELYAVEHWRSGEVVLHRREGTALPPVVKAKFKAIRSRRLPHANTRMHARGGLLAVSINDTVHIRTGETWRKLKITPTAALVAFAPATMKPAAAPDLPRPSASPAGAAYDQPRGDGLYAARDVSGWNIVRFVGDRTVLTASTMPEEKLKNVLKWLKPGKRDKPVPVEVTRDRVKWSDGAVAYDGTWSGEQLELAVESSNGYRATRRYDFYAEEQLLTSKSAK